MTACKNCETSFEGKHCPECGQKSDTHRFTLPHLAHEIFHAVTHTDKGILFLIKELFLYPGKVAREYNAGKRKKYFNPFTFLLIIVAIQIFVMKKMDFYAHFTKEIAALIDKSQKLSKNKSVSGSDEINLSLQDAEDDMHTVEENGKLLTFLFIPVVALFSWMFFRKSGYNYAENLVLNVMIFGQNIIYFLLVCIIPFMFNHTLGAMMLFVSFIVSIVYSIVAYKQFFQQGWGSVIWKTLVIQILYYTSSNLIIKAVSYII